MSPHTAGTDVGCQWHSWTVFGSTHCHGIESELIQPSHSYRTVQPAQNLIDWIVETRGHRDLHSKPI